ncbi:hypothetical protein SAMN06265795_11227 [Noviherbaspirillum humi]|uniref:DUF2076 domain-containing protein n=1 Tax=Noviherbaspirillum humi TaxID=1688639 RepID=A0A239JB15_9BURK|nr:DUF2076 domain-containing protein [Noviherbaspirillum humi]SNT02463.1 hypothetical protein SAMN06265795_11227 [Noviherbaspirillum humi]
MSPQEHQLLNGFLEQLVQARGISKDPEADTLIRNAVARQPDAAYLLVQRALLMDQALNNAKAEIARLESQVSQLEAARGGQGAGRGGFLDSASAWGNSASTPAYNAPPAQPGGRGMPAQAPAQPYAQAPMAQQGYAPPRSGFFGGGAGSLLGTAAATAAGVAGGAFLFQGIEHLMGGHHGRGFGDMANAGNAPVENTTVNNYYGSEEAPAAGLDNAGLDNAGLDNAGYDDSASFNDSGSDFGSDDPNTI